MLASMSQHLRVLVGLLDDLTLKDMETRLANWLLKKCGRTPGSAGRDQARSHETRSRSRDGFDQRDAVADAGKISRPTKLLRVKGNTIVLTKPAELQNLLERNLGAL